MRCEFWSQYPHPLPPLPPLAGVWGEEHKDYEIRYRSFGIMQILDMGHPEDDYTRGEKS